MRNTKGLAGGGRHAPIGFPKKGGFWRPHTLKHDGKIYQLDIWSAPEYGFWIICKNAGVTVHERTYSEAWTAFIKAIDPEIEQVQFA